MLMLRYCCNQKILHLERAIGPHILLYSQQFDYLIDTTYAQYFDVNFAANVDLAQVCIYKNSFTKNTVDPCLYKMKAPLGQSFQQSVPGFTQSSP